MIPKEMQSCHNCIHYEDDPQPKPYSSDCKTRHAAWYPQRGYGPCPHYSEIPLTDEI